MSLADPAGRAAMKRDLENEDIWAARHMAWLRSQIRLTQMRRNDIALILETIAGLEKLEPRK